MLPGQMMNRPLLISSLIDYAAEVHPDSRDRLLDGRGRRPPLRLRQARAASPDSQTP